MRSVRITLCFTVLLLLTGRLFAQAGATGTILGTVTDASGAIVPNAKVTVTNTDTNVPFRTTTSSAGDYYAPSLNPGTYKVTVESAGFQKSATDTFNLSVDQKVRADQDTAEAVGCRHPEDHLDGLAVVVAPVATHHERLPLKAVEAVEDGLDEVLDIAWALKDGHLLAQPGRTWLLPLEQHSGRSVNASSPFLPLRSPWCLSDRRCSVLRPALSAHPRAVSGA